MADVSHRGAAGVAPASSVQAELDALAARIVLLEAGSGGGTPSGAAGGNLGGTYPNPTVDGITLGSDARGDVYYRGAAGLERLAAGTSGQVLTTAGASANPTWTTAVTGLVGVFDVMAAAYGAVGDGVTDDTPAFKLAVAACKAAGGGTIFIPAKTFLLQRDPTTNQCVLLSDCHNITFLGLGHGSVIKMGTLSNSDLRAFSLVSNCSNITFRNLRCEGGFPVGTTTVGTTEQTHFIRIGGGAASAGSLGGIDVTIDGCTFKSVRGDGINGIGSNDGVGALNAAKRVRITNCLFDGCHRSGVGVQRQGENWHIINNHFVNTNDQDIDFEPTGNGENTGYIIVGNTIDHTRQSGNIAVTLTGVSASVERHKWSVFSDNVIINGIVSGLNVDGLVVHGNQITVEGMDDSEALIHFYRRADNLSITGNHIVRGFTGFSPNLATLDPGGFCLEISFNGGVTPRNVVIANNVFEQYSPKSVAVSETCSGVMWTSNKVIGRTGLTAEKTGIGVGASSASIERVMVNSNQIDGNQAFSTLVPKVRASQTLTFTGTPANNDTVTIAGVVYTYKTTLTPVANEVLIATGGTATIDSIRNLADAVTLGGGFGVQYAAATVANASCFASHDTTVNAMRISARAPGTAGNAIAVSESGANYSLGGATLAGGTQIAANIDCHFRAREAGAAGNSITIATVADGTGVGDWTVAGTALTYHFQDGVTTLKNMIERMRTDADATTLIDVEDKATTLGTVTNVLTTASDVFAATAMSGGGGTLEYGIQAGFNGGANSITGLMINGNQVFGAGTAEIRLNVTIVGYPIISGNNNAVAVSGLANAVAYVAGGNSSMPHLVCTGTPEAQVAGPVGATCQNLAGGAGTTFFIKESGTGNTGWVAL